MNETWWVKTEQLDEDQKTVIALPKEQSFLVTGPPGSGKTNLLLLRASYLAKAGMPDIVVLVFHRTLKDFLACGASNYLFSKNKIMTSMKWMQDLVRNNNGNMPSESLSFIKRRIAMAKEINRLIDAKKIVIQHEAILLDEAQDYWPEEIEIFSKLTKLLFAVADSRQKIYEGKSSLKLISEKVHSIVSLRYHYRTGIEICKLADELASKWPDHQSMASKSNYDENTMPSKVEIIPIADINDQCAEIERRLIYQLKAYPDEYVGVLCPRHKELAILRDFFLQSDLKEFSNAETISSEHLSFNGDKPIILSTVNSAKGLEFRAVHLASFEYISNFPKQRQLCFMATTRAKTSLSVYDSGKLPGYFEQAYNNISGPKQEPVLEDLFETEGK